MQCFVVATLASMTPAEPFLFRNYEHPLAAAPLARKLMAAPGSSSHEVQGFRVRVRVRFRVRVRLGLGSFSLRTIQLKNTIFNCAYSPVHSA